MNASAKRFGSKGRQAVPRVDVTANDRIKRRFRSIFWSGIIAATLAHFAIFVYWPEMTIEELSAGVAELTALELPPEIEIPAPPEAIARPARPVIASAEVRDDITIAPTTFDMNPVEALPPAPKLVKEVIDLAEQPTFTPFTVAPEILNREELIAAMVENYPPLLREARVGGVVRVFFFIDEHGVVQSTRIDRSSGYVELDAAALAVADLYRFRPALNRDQMVPVWVSFPIEFAVR